MGPARWATTAGGLAIVLVVVVVVAMGAAAAAAAAVAFDLAEEELAATAAAALDTCAGWQPRWEAADEQPLDEDTGEAMDEPGDEAAEW